MSHRGWEVKGIPDSLIKAMSGRSQDISDLAREYKETTRREPEAWVATARLNESRPSIPDPQLQVMEDLEPDCVVALISRTPLGLVPKGPSGALRGTLLQMLENSIIVATIPVTDLGRAKRFYGETLGLRFLWENPASVRFACGGGTELSIFRRAPSKAG